MSVSSDHMGMSSFSTTLKSPKISVTFSCSTTGARQHRERGQERQEVFSSKMGSKSFSLFSFSGLMSQCLLSIIIYIYIVLLYSVLTVLCFLEAFSILPVPGPYLTLTYHSMTCAKFPSYCRKSTSVKFRGKKKKVS